MPQALAELNDEELRGFDKTREDLDTQVHGRFFVDHETVDLERSELHGKCLKMSTKRSSQIFCLPSFCHFLGISERHVAETQVCAHFS